MVTAYWLIGWRIVEAEQGGRARAGYGERLIETVSGRLTQRYGKGYSVANLRNFREFYLAYPDRLGEIRYPLGSEWPTPGEPHEIRYPAGRESQVGFHPNLTMRALGSGEAPPAALPSAHAERQDALRSKGPRKRKP